MPRNNVQSILLEYVKRRSIFGVQIDNGKH